MFIGEGPGADEDRQGLPFVGRAGQKLDEMITYLGFRRDEVYICNTVKCRPPGNRNPTPGEAAACRHFLDEQIELIRPKVICLLGRVPLMYVTGNMNAGITKMRGQWIEHRGIPTLPTFHPSFLVRVHTIENRRAVASDMDALRKKLIELGCHVGKR
jgi:DNA polymerase